MLLSRKTYRENKVTFLDHLYYKLFACFLYFLQRTEMVEIQLDTYTADSISAHRKIRQEAFCSSNSLLLSCSS